MDPNGAMRDGLSNCSPESLTKEVNTLSLTASVSRPSPCIPARPLTDINAQAGIHPEAASPPGETLRSDIDPATRRRALLCRGAGGGILIAVAMISRHASAAGAMIAIDNFTFSPTPITVTQGTTVNWTNRDDIPHAIYCPGLSLKSQPLETNDVFRHRFEPARTFDYICSIHPNMRGRIVVSG